ncbi:MAG: phosphatidylserine decarboxylase [Alicyclobacillaceae bacterium]|nr:phosphatidylserine decarboxylase [Alicyclobacillaceae bacterium]
MRTVWTVILHVLPKRLLTALAGAFLHHPASRRSIPWFVRRYQVDLADAERPLDTYETLAALFVRRLRPGARPVAPDGVVSPVDGTVGAFGEIDENVLFQVKGSSYTLDALLANREEARWFRAGRYVTLYLSPRDYHRIHMPVDGRITGWRHIPGNLYPVNSHGVRHIRGVFTRNERVVTHVMSAHGRMCLVKVGATLVGSVRTPYLPQLGHPWSRRRRSVVSGQADVRLQRGDEIGWFDFGSTVVLLFEPGVIGPWYVEAGQRVKMGEPIAGWRSGENAFAAGIQS